MMIDTKQVGHSRTSAGKQSEADHILTIRFLVAKDYTVQVAQDLCEATHMHKYRKLKYDLFNMH